jgi:hypothetical protein
MTLAQLRESLLVKGPGRKAAPNWDAAWRLELVDNLAVLARQLWQVLDTPIFVDGSFVEAKDHPGDIDGYFACDPLGLDGVVADLNRIDPHQAWNWSERKPVAGSTLPKIRMWRAYHVELFPHYGQFTGIKDEFGNDLTFPAAFRKARREKGHKQKGIIQLIRRVS